MSETVTTTGVGELRRAASIIRDTRDRGGRFFQSVAYWLDSTADRHYPVEWQEIGEDGLPDLDKPLTPFCAACTDDEWVSAVEYGDTIDQSANVKNWPCPDAAAALAVARAYLGGDPA